MSDQPTSEANQASSEDSDFVWGAVNIGRVINRTAGQTYYLYSTGALEGAVVKVGHRTLLGFKRRLKNLGAFNK
jgi:hypothetical protein